MPNNVNASTQVQKPHSRQNSTSVLWGHLLSKDSITPALARNSASSYNSSIPPIAPADKTGTTGNYSWDERELDNLRGLLYLAGMMAHSYGTLNCL
ncbi:uncharacterized protein LAESUDRAFT_109092 [Laetiporus sulphureus 93-53]|uniref:Uncharacterized protein n=1 Tax=Laetiporus sulphureus 93-53 TaxID=1314785 RepID=A0A165EMU8_9APHY|nr:uncharacterized protein LAESUDRAFT_109092 [Laetiporus sulphureus 93-53]KZT07393.1 hypothetical protein LAESUDRAFT_109092 [Laetiporus sulphureus 93-53]